MFYLFLPIQQPNTLAWHSFYNGNQIVFRKFFPTLLQKFPHMCCTCRLKNGGVLKIMTP